MVNSTPQKSLKQTAGCSLPTAYGLLVRKGGLDPPPLSVPDPKSGASANSATFANQANEVEDSIGKQMNAPDVNSRELSDEVSTESGSDRVTAGRILLVRIVRRGRYRSRFRCHDVCSSDFWWREKLDDQI